MIASESSNELVVLKHDMVGNNTVSPEIAVVERQQRDKAVSPENVLVERQQSNTTESKMQLKFLIMVCRAIPVLAASGAVIYIATLIADDENWRTNADADPADKLSREKARGTFVSVVISILLNVIGAGMFYIGVKEGLVITNYGFILGPVVGFVLDQGVASDNGCRELFTWTGFKYSLSSLVGGNFVRYIITVFLDLFISNPLQDIMKRQAKAAGVIELLKEAENKPRRLQQYDYFVALNFPSILQSIVAFVTFNAYTNQTRFAWAYPAASLDRDLRIPPGTIMLATAASGVMYLVFYTVMDTFSDREYFAVNTKMLYVMVTLLILYGLNHTESVEAPVEGEEDNVVTEAIEGYKPGLGAVLLIGFIIYGFVYPIWTRLGCSFLGEKCKPSRIGHADHIIDEPQGMQISKPMLDAIMKRITMRNSRQQTLTVEQKSQ